MQETRLSGFGGGGGHPLSYPLSPRAPLAAILALLVILTQAYEDQDHLVKSTRRGIGAAFGKRNAIKLLKS